MRDTVNSESARRGAIILAGGDSKRLGQPKALLNFQGRPLIKVMIERLSEYFQEITIVTDRPDLYKNLPVQLCGDLLTEQQKSPLRGIHAGLEASDLSYQFVVACDMPMLNLDLIRYMDRFAAEYDAVVPHVGNYYQPLHSFYSRACIEIISKQVKHGYYKITDFYSKLKIRFITNAEIARFDPKQESFININTWPEYEQALEVYADNKKRASNGGGKLVENT